MIARPRPVAALALAVVLAVGAAACSTTSDTTSSGGAAGTAGAGTTTPALVGLRRDDPPDVAGLELTDARTGEPFSLVPPPGDLEIVYFGFTSCPDICPTTLSDLRKARKELGDDAARVGLTFVSVDPRRDTAAVLDGYIGSFVPDYHVVRIEDPAALAAVQAPFGARSSIGPEQADGTYEVKHTGTMYAVDPTGHVVLEWAFGTPPDAIAADLRLLLADADADPGPAGAATVPGSVPASP